ncbi:MAG: diadenylate cyclase CdaA [Polyangia bacterium]
MTLAAAPQIVTALLGMNWREVLTATADILIVYYIIYRVLKLVRGTRAAQTMAGMALIITVFFLAKRLELITVSWFFEKLIEYFIIFFVVIFQQDIRRALMQVGQNLFMRRQYEETYVIEEVVQAAGELAKQRIGALIVIERDADLTDHLGEVGAELDAKVTKELLVTLFVPEAANHLHDGAVIIRNLRIFRAGAVLPLSANTKLDKQLGTRHRAAIGVTEETDAVVVVVSEERGTVSLCFNGNIVRDLDAATLRKALLGLFKKKTKPKGQTGGRGKGDKSGDISLGGVPLPLVGGSSGQSQAGGATFTPQPAEVPPELMALVQTQKLERPPLAGEDTAPLSTRSTEVLARALEAGQGAARDVGRDPTRDTLPLTRARDLPAPGMTTPTITASSAASVAPGATAVATASADERPLQAAPLLPSPDDQPPPPAKADKAANAE